jgi:hypothetical protein
VCRFAESVGRRSLDRNFDRQVVRAERSIHRPYQWYVIVLNVLACYYFFSLDGRWENASVPRMDDAFYTAHGVDPDAIFFPAEETAWVAATDMIHMRNPYGLLRSPWNWNPSPYVARYNNINQIADIAGIEEVYRDFYSGVTCDDFPTFMELAVVDKPLCKFLHGAEDNIHGKIHFTFGGAGGDFALQTVSGAHVVFLGSVAHCGSSLFLERDYGRTL